MGSSLVSVSSVARSSAAALAVSFVVAIPVLADKNAPEPDLDPPMRVDPARDHTPHDQEENAARSAPLIDDGPFPEKAAPPDPRAGGPLVDEPVTGHSGKSSTSKGVPPEDAVGETARPIGAAPDSIISEPVTAPEPDPKPSASCPADVVWLRGDFGKARFSVDVADTRSARAQGLMDVAQMPASKGMLFVYEYPQEVAFWMKNTLIPLDIIFADEHGVVSSIQANAVPGDVTPLPGVGLIQYVLEINGGMAADLGILPGVQIQHPAIFSPIWPCD